MYDGLSTGLLTLRKLRVDGHQRISIQHIQVREGGQAIVGDENTHWLFGTLRDSARLICLSSPHRERLIPVKGPKPSRPNRILRMLPACEMESVQNKRRGHPS